MHIGKILGHIFLKRLFSKQSRSGSRNFGTNENTLSSDYVTVCPIFSFTVTYSSKADTCLRYLTCFLLLLERHLISSLFSLMISPADEDTRLLNYHTSVLYNNPGTFNTKLN